MRGTVLLFASCVLLSSCGAGSSDEPSSRKLTTIDQVPPECVQFFKKFTGCDKKAFDVLIASYDPKDDNAAQCAIREAETPAQPGCD